MSDTLTLYEKCPHGKLGECDTFKAMMRDGILVSANEVPWVKCPGGRERTFRWVSAEDADRQVQWNVGVWVEVDDE